MTATRSIAVNTLGNAVPPLASLAAAPILAQALGTAGRGEAGAATAPLALLTAGLTLGLPEAITYFSARRQMDRRGQAVAYVGLALVGLLGTAGIVTSASLLSGGSGELANLIALCGVAVAPTLLTAGLRATAAAAGRWSSIACERIVVSLARLLALLLMSATNTLTVTSAALTIAFVPLLGALLYFRRPAPQAVARLATTELLSFGLRIWPGSLSGILLARLDQTLVLPLSSAAELGLYVVAVSISEVPLIFNAAIREVLFSTESKDASVDRLAQAARLSTAATFVTCAFGAAVAWWVVPLLFGPEFAACLPALYILFAALIIGNPGSLAGTGLSARGRPELRSWSLAAALAVNATLVVILTPTLGAVGAALATLVGNALAGSCNILWMRRYGARASDFYQIRLADIRFAVRKVRSLTGAD